MITEGLAILGLAFLLGLKHALDADHVVAVSALVSKHKNLKKASILGAMWGLGHTTTLFFAGLLVMLLKITIPEKIAISLEFIVGIVIVVIGVSVIKDLIVNKKHLHKHTHNGKAHFHLHSHKEDREGKSHEHIHKPFAVGIIHGMAGSASLMLLVLSTVKSVWLGIAYILIFGIGSMIGMAIVSSLISLPFIFTKKNFSLTNKRMRYATGIFSIFFGFFIMARSAFGF